MGHPANCLNGVLTMVTKRPRRGRGEGSVYQRKDGRWSASLYLENGKRKTVYGKTRKEAYEAPQRAG
jgi:hypothetical protein